MAEKLINKTGLEEFSKKIKEKAVFIADTSAGEPSIFDLVYPVGSIYMSVNNVSPAALFGGTWTSIQDTFLLAAGSTYTAGSTGGSSTVKLTSANLPTHTHTYDKSASSTQSHTLTISEIPSHNHSISSNKRPHSENAGESGYSIEETYNSSKAMSSAIANTGGGGGHTHGITLTSTNTGNGGFSNTAHNNMPPYLTVYMWRRTA